MFGKGKRAAVLGCGPSGLFAAHALIGNGWDVTILSKKRKSEMFGAQYLHAPIPGLTPVESIDLNYVLDGPLGGYREKIYGIGSPIQVSVETLEGKHPAWDIRAVYNEAWLRYSQRIEQCRIFPDSIKEIRRSGEYKLIVNTIPLRSLCLQPDVHRFVSTSVWAIGDAPERGTFCPIEVRPNTVVCNGWNDTGWYRASNVFGYKTAEWPGKTKPPLIGIAEVLKPLYHDCTCHARVRGEANFIGLGRYGQWAKGVLSHHVFTQAAQL